MIKRFRKFRESETFGILAEILTSILAIIVGFGIVLLIFFVGIAEGWQF